MYEIKPGLLVFLGAALGTLSRALIDTLIASTFADINVSTVFVNVLGAFLMGGLITTWSVRRGMHPLWDRIKFLPAPAFLEPSPHTPPSPSLLRAALTLPLR
ncbi:FluC/FEX family fluoride channel [Gleimia europaea]|uniref:FluC/FEX family fluoride channel n=1 Tax=Gleimia europaea TaxID=66228 RepID=UPI0026584433|nr:CrcB family protein [Gleimia europaea]WIK62832.1 CrcB family protein [Gleimia europaea]